MKFNHIFVCFVIFFFSHIEILIDFYPFYDFSQIRVKDYQYIATHNHSHILLFLLMNINQLKLFEKLSFIYINRLLFSPKLLLQLVKSISSASTIYSFIDFSEHINTCFLSFNQFIVIFVDWVGIFQDLFYDHLIPGYSECGLF